MKRKLESIYLVLNRIEYDILIIIIYIYILIYIYFIKINLLIIISIIHIKYLI